MISENNNPLKHEGKLKVWQIKSESHKKNTKILVMTGFKSSDGKCIQISVRWAELESAKSVGIIPSEQIQC